MINKALFTNNSDEWYTPREIFNIVDQIYHFTLDPCGCKLSHMCNKYYDIYDNGLTKSWAGEKVFCNPPYSDIKSWVVKSYLEYQINNTLVCMLIPVRTDTKYFHDYIYNKAELVFLKGRIRFSGSENSAPFPSMFVIFDPTKKI